ncbi:DUF2254 family protein [Methanosphaerula subterraneus]|uniref:DUF2254 family protein n=1 Tax=Methanosphaerula subterraneus TaxID=3350244 RepID=UPI003F87B06A
MSTQILKFLKTILNGNTHFNVIWFLFAIIIAVPCFLISFTQGNFDADSIRTLISTIIQAQIAGVGIILSATFIVIQIMAQTYTSRGINLFRTDNKIKLLITIFVILILYGILLLSSISLGNKGNVFIALFSLPEIYIQCLIFFELLSGSVTIPLMYAFVMGVVDILDPENASDYLTRKVDAKKVSPTYNPFQNHFNILHHAIGSHDTTTIGYAIDLAISDFDDKMKNEQFRTVEKNSYKFYNEIKKLGKRLLDADFDNNIAILLYRVQDSFESALKNPNETLFVTTDVKLDTIYNIAKEAIHHKNLRVLSLSIEILGEIGRKSIENNSDKINQNIAESCLNKILQIGRDISDSDLIMNSETRNKIIKYMKFIGFPAINDHLEMAEIAPKNLAEFFFLFPSDSWRQELLIQSWPIPLLDDGALKEFTVSFVRHYRELQGLAVYET